MRYWGVPLTGSLSLGQPGMCSGVSGEGGPAAEWEPVCDSQKGPTRWFNREKPASRPSGPAQAFLVGTQEYDMMREHDAAAGTGDHPGRHQHSSRSPRWARFRRTVSPRRRPPGCCSIFLLPLMGLLLYLLIGACVHGTSAASSTPSTITLDYTRAMPDLPMGPGPRPTWPERCA